jgi:hypothetical protein
MDPVVAFDWWSEMKNAFMNNFATFVARFRPM